MPEISSADAVAAAPPPVAMAPREGQRSKAWPLRANASPEERIRFLGTQLDALTSDNRGVVLDRFKLLGAQARRPAGALPGLASRDGSGFVIVGLPLLKLR